VRLAQGFIRFGSFELCYPGNGSAAPSAGLEEEVLDPLLEYAISRHFPEVAEQHPRGEARTAEFLRAVAERTAKLVAAWQAVGFVHGVLNTDNMAITGETIDYGPFGFLNMYDPDYVPNSSDAAGRYCYSAQPAVCYWNLERLAESLAPRLGPVAAAEALADYWRVFEAEKARRFRAKLGLRITNEAGDEKLLGDLLELMQRTGADFTNCFRALSREPFPLSEEDCATPPQAFDAIFEYFLAQCATAETLLKCCKQTLHPNALARLKAIAENRPEQLEAFGLSLDVVERESARARRREELTALSASDKRLADAEGWREWLERYRRRLWRERCAVETAALRAAEAAGLDAEEAGERALFAVQRAAIERCNEMNRANPRFILRQHIAATAIERAEVGDFREIREVLALLRRPYDEQGPVATEKYAMVPPDWAYDLVLN